MLVSILLVYISLLFLIHNSERIFVLKYLKNYQLEKKKFHLFQTKNIPPSMNLLCIVCLFLSQSASRKKLQGLYTKSKPLYSILSASFACRCYCCIREFIWKWIKFEEQRRKAFQLMHFKIDCRLKFSRKLNETCIEIMLLVFFL